MRTLPSLQVNPSQRFASGVIAVLTDGTTRHFVGAGTDATRAVADYCDRNGCKVRVLSTPSTVYRDLQGTRMATLDRGGDSPFYAPPQADNLVLPEASMLGAIHRTDLLA